MQVPYGSNFKYEEDGISFRIFYQKTGVKLYARLGKKTVIEYEYTPHECAEKTKKRLNNPKSNT